MTLTSTASAPSANHPQTHTATGAATVRAAITRRAPLLGLSALAAVLSAMAGLVPYLVVYLAAVELFVTQLARPEQLSTLALIAAGAVLAKALLRTLATYLSHITAYGVLAELRRALAHRLRRMPLGRVRARPKGQLKKVVQDDVEQLELGLSHAIPDVAAAIAVPVASLVVMAIMDWRITLAAGAVVVLVPLCVGWATARTSGLAGRESAAKQDLNTSVLAFLGGIRVIRGFLQGERAFTAVDDAVGEVQDVEDAKMARGRTQAVLVPALVSGSALFILPLGTYLVATGSLDVATLIFFLLVGVGFAQPLLAMTMSFAVLQYQVEAGLRQITSILDEPELPVVAHPGTPQGHAMHLVQVHFSYPDVAVETLGDISLSIPEQSSVALIGPTGAGKSTLLHLLARFYDVTGGSITLGGVDLREMDPAELMRRVALVQQDEHLFEDTLLENIRLARPNATDEEVIAAGTRARVAEIAKEFEGGWRARISGTTLSGGQRQRISIARALLKDAQVVLLDEATAFLDPENELAVTEALSDLAQGRTVVSVAHRLNTVTGYDMIVLLNHGQVVATGTHQELLQTCAQYRQMWSDFQAGAGWRLTGGNASAAQSTPAGTVAGPSVATDHHEAAGQAAGPHPSTSEPRPRAEQAAHHTPVVPGLAQLGLFRQWLAMLGRHRAAFFRAASWRIIVQGALTSAPLFVVLVALFAALRGELTVGSALGYAVVLLGMFTARVVIGVTLAARWWPEAMAAIADLRRSLLHRLRSVPLGFFDRVDRGRTATTTVTDLPLVDFITLPGQAVAALVQPVLALVALLVLDWRLALLAFAGVPVFLILLWVSDRGRRRSLKMVTENRHQANASLLEFVDGSAVLRAHPGAPQAIRYHHAIEDLRRSSIRMAVRSSPLTGLATALLELGFAALIVAGSSMYLAGEISAVTLLVFLVISPHLYQPYQELAELTGYRHLQQRIATQIAEVWDTPTLPRPVEPAEPAHTGVEFDSVGFGYSSSARVLSEVSFRAQPGTITAIVGASGAGKSTVTNLIARFWDVDDGAITLGGADLRSLAPSTLMSQVTTVYQDVYLFADSVRANLMIGAPHATEEQLRAVLHAAQAYHFVMNLPQGLDTVLSEGGQNLSGGERQRLSIARALLKDAPIVLLDEAVAALDPGTEVLIQEAIGALATGRTVIVVAHRLNTVQSVDQIVVLDDGRVAGVGSHTELLHSCPRYQVLWAAHEKSHQLRVRA